MIVESVNKIKENSENITYDDLRESAEKMNPAFMKDVNDMLAYTFKFIHSLSPEDKVKTAEKIKYVNDTYYDEKLSLRTQSKN